MKQGARILVIDDSPSVLHRASELLREAGYVVWEAADLEQLTSLLTDSKPDLCLVDVNLPDVFGYDLRGYMKDKLGVQSPMLLFSTDDPDSLADHAKRYGFDGFIHKDDGLDGLVPAVKAF